MWNRLVLVPVGPGVAGILEELASLFSRRTPLTAEVVEGIIWWGKGQGDARDLLERLPPGQDAVVLGVTGRDLGSPGKLYVYGQGAVGHGLGVVSFYRLLYAHQGWSPSPDLLLERLYKVALHEVGHALGLSHCDRECAMGVYPSVYQLDRAPGEFCTGCRARLGWPL